MGRHKEIETPERLWELFLEFMDFCKVNPIKEHDFVGKDATEVHRNKVRPITWIGFEGWLSINGIVTHLGHYEQNTSDSYTDYLPIIRAIKKICAANVIEGALAGVYNQNIAARIEGLVDKSQVENKGVAPVINFTIEPPKEADE